MPVMRIPALGLLWLVLVLGYLGSTTLGHLPAALAVLGLMAGALLASLGRPYSGLAAGVTLAFAAWRYADAVPFLVYLPPLAGFAFMSVLFGRTLREGSEPLISRIARKEHPDLTPQVARHTRLLTVIWAACFAALFIVALGLAPFVSLVAWSRWVQMLGMIVPIALFFSEYLSRQYRFPGREQGSLEVLVTNVIAVFRERGAEPARRVAQGGEPQ